MDTGEGPYRLKRLRLVQSDLYAPDEEKQPWPTVMGSSEEFFVIGKIRRNNADGEECFLPDRCDGKICSAFRSEGWASQLCYTLNVSSFYAIWKSYPYEAPTRRVLLIDATLHYFAPGLEYAIEQARREGYERALTDLIRAAPRHETWYISTAVACLNQGEAVSIKSPRTPSEAPPLLTLPFAALAQVAFPMKRMGEKR
ncbi:hypothetical protein KSF_106850 [Reticulibacter mediterranei]|uniref:Uncharacterized protein n=1 Tax=Reticulibacter mediterranei TaxID=2778369 RepID=A0A8J3NAQ5_9CHLR|nr:hypothetical protein [Reticulibacter mediterranei]GHP00638.1 hypothetical protein KSF_106850 [Reticulibacter mediterranei]